MKNNNWKRIGKGAALAIAIVVGGGFALSAISNVGKEQDRADLLAIKAAYEDAINTGNAKGISAHLDPEFTYTTLTGLEIKGAQQFSDGIAAVKAFVGPKGSYTVSVQPAMGKTTFFKWKGNELAVARGTTTDKVTVDSGGKTVDYDFASLWFAVLNKDGGNWKLVHAYAMFTSNPFSDAQLQKFNAALTAGAPKTGEKKGG